MSDLPDRALLEPAIEAARRALREMEDEEVPARLRRVAASSARRLPGPFAESLVSALDDDGWLRRSALEAWEDADPDDPDPRRAVSALFLLRPDGWRERTAVLQAAAEHHATASRAAEAESRATRLEERIRELEGQLKAAQDRAGRVEARVRGELGAELERVSEAAADLRRRIGEVERRATAEEARARRLEADLAEADRRIGTLRDRLLRERRPGETGSRAAPAAFGRGDPVGMARLLDQLVASIRPPAAEPSPEPVDRSFVLPPGTRPDRAEAVDWVLRAGIPVTLVVDGYNVAHELDPDPGPAVRARVVHALERIRRLADGPVRAVVFWDSTDQPDTVDRGGVGVRFVPDADAAIVAEAGRLGGAVVVVSADRAVRERAEEAGAVGLWSGALLDWMG